MREFISFLLLGMGALALLVSLVLWVLWRRGTRRNQEVRAKVIENVRRRDAHGGALYFPMLEFEWEGAQKRIESAFGTPWEQYQPWEQVTAYYDPQNDRMVLKTQHGPRIAALVILVLACLLLLSGGALLLLTFL